MLYRAGLFDIFILIQSDIAVLVLCASHGALRACVLVELTLTKGIFNAFGIFVNGVLSAGDIDAINMLGREQIAARLELRVVGRGSDAKSSCGPPELR
eukprot:1851580-Pyramimonas_sp.AAC.1